MVCAITFKKKQAQATTLFKDLITELKADFDLKNPGFSTWYYGDTIYIPHPPALEQMHAHKLEMSLGQMVEEGILAGTTQVQVLDKNVKGRINLVLEIVS